MTNPTTPPLQRGPTDRTDRSDHPDLAVTSDDGPVAIADGCDLPPEATVLVMPRGAFYHLPMGPSNIPLCDASSVPISRITAQTRYHAAIEADLDPCQKCLHSAGVESCRDDSTTPAAD